MTGGTVDTTQQHSPGLFLEQDIVALEQQSTSETSQFVRMVHRERLSLLRLRQEIHNTVHVWTEIMEGRVDNRHAAHTLENTVSKYQAPIRWKEWGGDWILATELGEFLELLKQRQQYWENVFVPSNAVALGAGVGGSVIQYQRQIWWGALSRPESLLGVVIYDSGHGWHLGGMGDVVGRVSGVFGGVVGWWCGGAVVRWCGGDLCWCCTHVSPFSFVLSFCERAPGVGRGGGNRNGNGCRDCDGVVVVGVPHH